MGIIRYNYTIYMIFFDAVNNCSWLWSKGIKDTNPSDCYDIAINAMNEKEKIGLQIIGCQIYRDFRGYTVPLTEFDVGERTFDFVLPM